MAKADPRETTGREGPVRRSSGTRVVAVRLTPLEPSVVSQRGANDIHQMPTRELDLEQLRAMALRCASDVVPGVPADDRVQAPTADAPPHPRLELVLTEDEAPLPMLEADPREGEAQRSRRSTGLALVLLLVAVATASVAALELYGVLPWVF